MPPLPLTTQPPDDLFGMRLALTEAAQAAMVGEVPVGAVVLRDGRVLGQGGNRRESQNDPTAHAEILALRSAAASTRSWRLTGATLYVTQEPCPMCAGALINARIARLVFGCANPKAGSIQTLYQLVDDPRFNHRVSVEGGLLADECAALLQRFFQALRSQPRSSSSAERIDE